MNRYPNLVGFGADGGSGRGNGFLRRKAFTVPGVHSFTLPADLPTDHRGLIRVKVALLGGGSGGSDANDASAINAGGCGGGYSHKELWVPPASEASITVGAAGPSSNSSPTNRVGGTSSVSIAGVSLQATGGGHATGGEGSGGDVNTKGGGRTSRNDDVGTISGASSGSPWADGLPGLENGTSLFPGYPKWMLPTFWDLEDFAWLNNEDAAFREITGIGHGGWIGDNDESVLPAFGGGGVGGWGSSQPGGGGLVIFYF